MIVLSPADKARLGQMMLTPFEQQIVQSKEASPVPYRYSSLEDLIFELNMRASIVDSASALLASGVKFAAYDRSRCNEWFWSRMPNGGFRLKNGVRPSDAINDIYRNGPLYAFECSMAIVIVLYKAILDRVNSEVFDNYFRDLTLYDWQYDNDLRLIPKRRLSEAYPGDILYFKNPDVNPQTPEWQGENVILMGNDQYYGHGIGIRSAADIIAALNHRRRPGATVSAYLKEQVLELDTEHIRRLRSYIARIGSRRYFQR